MTSYLFPSSLAPLHVFVIAGQTPAPHVVIWGSDKCLQAVITSGRIHSVSIWKAARRRRCHSLSCQQGELKREEKKLKEKKKKRTDKGNFSLTSFPDGKAITRSRLYISARVREGMLQLQALLQSLERLGGEEDNLHDLGSLGFDHDLHKTMGVFKMARQMGSKPNCNTTQQNLAKHNFITAASATGQPLSDPSCSQAGSCPHLWGRTGQGRGAWFVAFCISTKNC